MNLLYASILILYLSIPHSLISSIEIEVQQAAVLYEAKEYPQAQELYQNILQEPLNSWQKAVIMYNLGNSLLANGQWDKAVETFSAIPFDNELAPVLTYRTKYNTAVAQFQKAYFLIKNNQKASELIQKTIQSIPEIEKAYCNLENAKGNATCFPNADINNLKKNAQLLLSAALKQEEESRISQTTIQDGIPLLINGIGESLDHLIFLEQTQLSSDLQATYSTFFVKESQAWNPLWESQKEKLLENTQGKEAEGRNKLFATAEQEYTQAINEMGKGNNKVSREAFEASANHLKSIIPLLPPKSKMTEQIQPPKETQATPEQQTVSKSEQAIKLLLEMSQQDTIPITELPTPKKVSRPW